MEGKQGRRKSPYKRAPLLDQRSRTGAMDHKTSAGRVGFHADEETMLALKTMQRQVSEMRGYTLHSAVLRDAVKVYAAIVADNYADWKDEQE
jgi:hypothetical protein